MLLTTRGTLFLLAAAPLMALATWYAPLEWIAWGYVFAATALIGIDWFQAGNRDRFEIGRHHDQKLSLGAENLISLTVSQKSRWRSRGPLPFVLRDEPPDAFVTDKRLMAGELEPFGEWSGSYHVRPLRRGDYAFGNITLRWPGPLNLVRRQVSISNVAPVKVYPNLLSIRRYDMLLRQNRLQELGLRHTRRFGQGTEFERLRDYQPDDEYRRINWKATARRGRPITAEFQTERSQNIITMLDIGRMMQSPVADMAKLDYVINSVLLLGYVAASMGDKVGLMTFADQVVNFLSPKIGRGQFYRMLELLYRIEPQPVEPNYHTAFSYLGRKERKRALVLIFTDLSGGLSMESLINHTTALSRRSLPVVVTINDPDVVALAKSQPTDSSGVYQQAAALELLEDRQLALDKLHRNGVLTLDVPANQLSIAVINRYIELKGRQRL